MENFFGLNWDRKLGFNTLQKYNFLPIGEKPESIENSKKILMSYDINNLESGNKWIKKNYDNPAFFSIASSIYKLYGKNQLYYDDNQIKKKYVNYKIYTDDTIKMIKKKIMLLPNKRKQYYLKCNFYGIIQIVIILFH